jgi:hypothetical protein
MTADLYRATLREMVDPHHSLVRLTGQIPWAALEAQMAPLLEPKRSLREVPQEDLFGPSYERLSGVFANIIPFKSTPGLFCWIICIAFGHSRQTMPISASHDA